MLCWPLRGCLVTRNGTTKSRGVQTEGPSDISWRAWTGRRMRWTNTRHRSEERNTNDLSEGEFRHHHGHHGHHKCHKKNWRHQERGLGHGEGQARLGFGRKRLLGLLQYLLRAEDEGQGENPAEEEVVEASSGKPSDGKKGKREKRICRRRRWFQEILENLGPEGDGLQEAHTGDEAGASGVAETSEGEGLGAVGEGAGEMEQEPLDPSADAGKDPEEAPGDWRQRLIAELCEKLFGNDGASGELASSSAEEGVAHFGCRRGWKHGMKRFGCHRSRSEDGPRKTGGDKPKGCRRKGRRGASSSSSSSEDDHHGKKGTKRGPWGCKRSGMYKMKGPCGGRMRRRLLMRELLFSGGFPLEGGQGERMRACRGMPGIRDFRNRCVKKRMMKKAFKRFY